jgi:hypothetical protein
MAPSPTRTARTTVTTTTTARTVTSAVAASRGAPTTTPGREPVRLATRVQDSRFQASPRPAAAIVVRAIVEALSGVRPVAHLTGWTTPQLQSTLERFRVQNAGRGTVRSIRISQPRPGAAEVCAVISRGDRIAALALRMESTGGRWRVTALQIG